MPQPAYKRLWQLVDNEDSIIDGWARELKNKGPLAALDLSARQRRVIARLRWKKEVAKLQQENDPGFEHLQQPPPIAGQDANGRIVVQYYEWCNREPLLKMYALTRDGEPYDIKPPVKSLKDGRKVPIPRHIKTIEER